MMFEWEKARHVVSWRIFLAMLLRESSQHSWENLERERLVENFDDTNLCSKFSPQTTLLNVLAERQAAGVVSGERLVNGYPLPSDFQAQT